MTRKISAKLWKIAVFEIPLSPWVTLEYFTQGNSLINSELYPRKSISLSTWVGGPLLINKYILFLILIRGYSITQGKPFYSIYIYIYIYYIYIYIRYLDSRTTTKFPWVNHSRELKGTQGNWNMAQEPCHGFVPGQQDKVLKYHCWWVWSSVILSKTNPSY